MTVDRPPDGLTCLHECFTGLILSEPRQTRTKPDRQAARGMERMA
ncbi:hypothetical protein B2K_40210 [Paenibacillus mucilaginosus K02]|uniref:Uncharacterized protein n=1 Tax=Paenibacillus mucilaginosus K02 TaxID=997761 RepID=R9UNF4_9BACL|nr:hypothetical protein B2K_40210 [Paenibacillus mucilaginosus K02]